MFSVAHLFLPSSLVGVLRVWDASTACCVYAQTLATVSEEEDDDDNPRGLTYLLHLPASSRLATVTAEHNILLYQLPGFTTQQQVGTEDTRVGCFLFLAQYRMQLVTLCSSVHPLTVCGLQRRGAGREVSGQRRQPHRGGHQQQPAEGVRAAH